MKTDTEIGQNLAAALRCQQAGNVQEALRHCAAVLAILPDQPDALQLCAVLHAQQGHYPQADACFRRAAAAAPRRADILGNHAHALYEQGLHAEAEATSRRALAIDPQRAELHNGLGNSLLANENFDAAAASFRTALALRPAYPHAFNNLGNALQKLGNLDEAVAAYRQALEHQPAYPEALDNLGVAQKQLGHIEAAAASFRQAVALRPDFAKAAAHLQEVDAAWLQPLAGRRLLLRRYTASDADFLMRCHGNAPFMTQYNRFAPRQWRREHLVARLRQSAQQHPCQNRSVEWVICRKDDGRPIGLASLTDIQFAHRRAEFLIGIPAASDQSTGAGLEASLLVLDFAFNGVGLHKVTNIVYGDNPQAQKNTLAIGFVAEGFQREHVIDQGTGKPIDLYINGMTLRDFRGHIRLASLSKRLLGRDIVGPMPWAAPQP